MPEKIFHWWRVLATGCCFSIFGEGGVVLRFVYFPLLHLVVWNTGRRVRLARSVIQSGFRIFVVVMQALGVLRYEIIGHERLRRSGLLILANHPSLIDTVFLMALVKNADCIVKAELQANFFTRGPVRAAGYVFNDQGMGLVQDCIASLERGNNLIVFPEGTRTPPDGSIRLKRGAANIAVRAQRPITPVIVECQPKTLGKGEKWWLIPATRVTFRIIVQDDIDIAPFIDGANGAENAALAARNLTAFLQTYFTKEIQRHA